MSDKKLELSRRNMLAGLGTIGIASAGAGMGTSAYFNDKERIANNTVTAGKLDLKLDWWQAYWQGEKKGGWTKDYQPPDDNPGPIYQIEDAKPGDWGCGLISIHLRGNPAYVWAGCNLKQWENGQTEPEAKVDDSTGKYEGELAENIKVALLRFPYVAKPNALASEQTDYQAEMQEAYPGDRDIDAMDYCTPIFKTTLKDLCENKLHKSYLLDGKPGKEGKCFRGNHTYWYGFCWWIPKEVGNEIQTDGLKFDLKFGAVQCRHLSKDKASNHVPFDSDGQTSSTESTETETA